MAEGFSRALTCLHCRQAADSIDASLNVVKTKEAHSPQV